MGKEGRPTAIENQCQADKPLARIAMVNNMLAKTTTENEKVFLKRGSSGSSEERRRRSIPHKITHSASDTACNQGKIPKPETKKRRSMSDYLDMKRDKQSFAQMERASMRTKVETQPSQIASEQKSELIPANARKEESNKPPGKNKM